MIADYSKRPMSAKEFLSQAWQIDERIERKIEERDRIENKLTTGRISNITGMPRGGGYDWTDAVSSIIRLTEQINAEITRLCVIKRQVNDAIDAVADMRYRRLLELRYRNYLTWEQIADDMHYDVRSVYKLHGKALLAVRIPQNGHVFSGLTCDNI